jgi:hypothetical protein
MRGMIRRYMAAIGSESVPRAAMAAQDTPWRAV